VVVELVQFLGGNPQLEDGVAADLADRVPGRESDSTRNRVT
jgi:hypothetical protein